MAARPLFHALAKVIFPGRTMKFAAIFIALLLLASCDRSSTVPTAEENRQLDDAANLLNEAPANLESIDDSALLGANETDAAAQNATP
jgi:hypothetical protein